MPHVSSIKPQPFTTTKAAPYDVTTVPAIAIAHSRSPGLVARCNINGGSGARRALPACLVCKCALIANCAFRTSVPSMLTPGSCQARGAMATGFPSHARSAKYDSCVLIIVRQPALGPPREKSKSNSVGMRCIANNNMVHCPMLVGRIFCRNTPNRRD